MLVFIIVKIQVEVFRFVMLCSAAVGYQNFGKSCCIHLWHECFPKQYPTTTLHRVTTQEDLNLNLCHCENVNSHILLFIFLNIYLNEICIV